MAVGGAQVPYASRKGTPIGTFTRLILSLVLKASITFLLMPSISAEKARLGLLLAEVAGRRPRALQQTALAGLGELEVGVRLDSSSLHQLGVEHRVSNGDLVTILLDIVVELARAHAACSRCRSLAA